MICLLLFFAGLFGFFELVLEFRRNLGCFRRGRLMGGAIWPKVSSSQRCITPLSS